MRTLNQLIHNDNRPGNWHATVYAYKNSVNSFQCRTPGDADEAVRIIRDLRNKNGLPTTRATRREVLAGSGRALKFGPVVEIDLASQSPAP